MDCGASSPDSDASNHASAQTVASVARLEALANLEAEKNAAADKSGGEDAQKLTDGCRLAYSSILAVESAMEAQKLLASVFTHALTNNPKLHIGGILFYDEKTTALVQVLEGPAEAVRTLYHQKIKMDMRHTSAKLLWDQPAEARQYEGFGMMLGSDPTPVLQQHAELLQLTYASQLTATTREKAYEDIQAILAVAVVTNPRLGIGGALFLNPRTLQVLQALEGPEANVRQLYKKIADDGRHTSCAVISELAVTERTYEQWGMLQGDLKDWSSLAGGKLGMKSVTSRRRRGRENMDEDDGQQTRLGGVSNAAVLADQIQGSLQVSAGGKPVIAVDS